MKASELIARCLENEGVKYVFGVPGEEILDIVDSMIDSSVRFIPTRHEQGAAFMADAYGRLTGRAGVCLATLGPGATNLATGVADANLDHAPLVAITGQAGRDRIHKESHQYVDIVELMRPLTKWNARAEMPVVIPEVIRKAFKVAEAEKPGACHIEVPEDVAEEEAEGEPLSTERPRRPSPDRQALQSAARLIEAASFPLIFAGNGVIRGGASKELRDFSRTHGIPVVNTFMAKGCMPYDDPLALRCHRLDLLFQQRPIPGDDRAEGMPVEGIAVQRLRMQHELAALGLGRRRRDRDLAADLWTTPAVQDRICFDGRYGSHQSIRPLGGAVAPGHHGYPHAPVLDNSLASGAVVATRLQARQLDRSSISLIPSREPRRQAFSLRFDVSRPLRGFRREVWVIATLLGEHACWPEPPPAHCDAGALRRPRASDQSRA